MWVEVNDFKKASDSDQRTTVLVDVEKVMN